MAKLTTKVVRPKLGAFRLVSPFMGLMRARPFSNRMLGLHSEHFYLPGIRTFTTGSFNTFHKNDRLLAL